MDKQQLILRTILTITIILGFINLIFIAHLFYYNIKPLISNLIGLRDIDFEGITAISVVLFTPFLVLYFNFRDSFYCQAKGEQLNFAKSFTKGLITSLIVGGIMLIIVSLTCSGEECIGTLTGVLIAIGGAIFSLVITTIFYFISKNRINLRNQ